MTIEVPMPLLAVVLIAYFWVFGLMARRAQRAEEDLYLTWRFLQKPKCLQSECTVKTMGFVLFDLKAKQSSCLFSTYEDLISFVNSPALFKWIAGNEERPIKVCTWSTVTGAISTLLHVNRPNRRTDSPPASDRSEYTGNPSSVKDSRSMTTNCGRDTNAQSTQQAIRNGTENVQGDTSAMRDKKN